jgi:nucleoside-diphosphate-sugar epimerase
MNKVLVTGGAGFIGFHLSSFLVKHGYKLTILDNFARGVEDKDFEELISKKNVQFVKGDITKESTFEKLDSDFDYIYHLAAINGTENFYKIPDKVLKVGAVGTLNILDWFSQCKKGKILFSSSSEVYSGGLKLLGDKFPIPTPEDVPLVVDDPTNLRWSYGASKIIGEVAMYAYAKAYNINFSIIRYHNIYGPRMGFEHVIPQFIGRIMKKDDPFKIFGGEETRTFCFIDDAIFATKMVMESNKTNRETIHIGRNDGEIKIIDLAKRLFKIAKVNPAIEINKAPLGSVMRRCPDTTKLKSLGFKAKTDLNEGLRCCYDWYKDKF